MKIGKKSSGTWRRRQDKTVEPKATAAKLYQCHVLTFISSGGPIIIIYCVWWLSKMTKPSWNPGYSLRTFKYIDRFILEPPWVINVWCLHGSSAQWYFAELSFAFTAGEDGLPQPSARRSASRLISSQAANLQPPYHWMEKEQYGTVMDIHQSFTVQFLTKHLNGFDSLTLITYNYN